VFYNVSFLSLVASSVVIGLMIATAPVAAQDAQKAIEQGAAAWETAFNAGDGKGVADLYTEDAVLLPPGAARVDGKAAIGTFWQGAIDSGLTDADLETLEVVEAGDLAVEVGTVGLSAPTSDGGSAAVTGKYIVVWQRGDDGTWRLHRDIWNMNPAE
jgi:uncharacterized protein (TIGR02246 family)